jgi:uncharacterized membrane protein
MTATIAGYTRTFTLVAIIGAATSGGVFFAFSTFIMKALDRLPDEQAIAAMQQINKAAPSPWFMTALFGTAAVSIGLAVGALRRLSEPFAPYLLIGGALYLVGIVLTIAYHVPRNNALAVVDPTSPGAAQTWARYVSNWTAWNHVRTLSSLAGAVSFLLALIAR